MVSLFLGRHENDLTRGTGETGCHVENSPQNFLHPGNPKMAYSKNKEIGKEWAIPSQGEFRFEVSFDQKISIQVHNIIYISSYVLVD
jgi:hypothetical protein